MEEGEGIPPDLPRRCCTTLLKDLDQATAETLVFKLVSIRPNSE